MEKKTETSIAYILGIMAKKMEITMYGLGFRIYDPAEVDRTWGIWGSYYNIPKAIWGTVKIMVPFWVPIIIRGLIRGLI